MGNELSRPPPPETPIEQWILDLQQDVPTRVGDNLIVCAQCSVRDLVTELRDEGKVVIIVNCASDHCRPLGDMSDIPGLSRLLYLPLKDEPIQQLPFHLIEDLCKLVASFSPVVPTIIFHCVEGRSRSVACLIAYIMSTHRLSYDVAYNMVKTARDESIYAGFTGPNDGFKTQLIEYGQQLADGVGPSAATVDPQCVFCMKTDDLIPCHARGSSGRITDVHVCPGCAAYLVH